MTVTEDTVSKWGLSGPYWGVASKKPPQLTGTAEAPVGLTSAPQSLSEHLNTFAASWDRNLPVTLNLFL